jgi:RNA polymerase sigma factor for flagellar operon FliA
VIPPPTDAEHVFLSNLPLIERIIGIQVRRHALGQSDAEEFASWAKARLIANDYAVIRKFAGRSALATFLTTVLANLFSDFRNSQWGRWRPSAAAIRHGPIAIRLEQLLYRDGHDLREATEILRATGLDLPAADIARLAAKLPVRETNDEIPLDKVLRTEQEPTTEAGDWERAEATATTEKIIQDVIGELPPEDALIIRMRFWNDQSIADIARALRLDQKALYRRVEAIRLRLNRELASRGIDRAAAADLLQAGD